MDGLLGVAGGCWDYEINGVEMDPSLIPDLKQRQEENGGEMWSNKYGLGMFGWWNMEE